MPSRPSPALRPLVPGALALVALAASAGIFAPAVDAQDAGIPNAAVVSGSGPLEASIAAELLEVRTGPGGREIRRWIPAQRLSAGDEVHYTVRVRNPGEAPVADVVVTKRLPFGVVYQPGSAAGPACDVQFSADGGLTFAPPERPRAANLRKSARKGPAPEYTHVRWVMRKPLAPGATALLRFRAVFA